MADCGCSSGTCCEEWVVGSVISPIGEIPKITGEWSKSDKMGQLKARILNSFRSDYKVEPGLYACGNPDNLSDVFVSANYKLSFDILRKEIGERDAWIVVLDTKGINVWCAAGKGTFGTDELISKIKELSLDRIVDSKKVIIPQLGAAGVSGHIVEKETGFKVIYGPVMAKDITTYIENGYKADEEMRSVPFSFKDRLVLIPMEVSLISEKVWLFIVGILIFFGLMPQGILFKEAFFEGGVFIVFGLLSVFSGAVLTPALLPFIPFRSFAIKGWLLGELCVVICLISIQSSLLDNYFIFLAICLFFPVVSSYLAFNFTGCSTYTSVSGVKKEMKLAIPLYIIASSLAGLCLILYKIQVWRSLL